MDCESYLVLNFEWTACTSSRIYCDNIISGCSGCLIAQINDCDYFFGFWNSHNPNISKAIAGMKFPTIRLIPSPEASPTGTVGVMKELLIATPAARVARAKHPIPFFCRFVMFYYSSKIYWTTAKSYSISTVGCLELKMVHLWFKFAKSDSI